MAWPRSNTGRPPDVQLWITIFFCVLFPLFTQVAEAQVSFSISSSQTVTEDDGTVTFTVTASATVTNAIVNLVYCGNLQDSDFDTNPETSLNFVSTGTVVLSLDITDDQVIEGTEAFHIILDSVVDNSGSQTLSIGSPNFAVLEITDNDAEFSFVDATYFASAAIGSVDVYVEASLPVTDTIDITLTVVPLALGTCTLPTGLTAGDTVTCTMTPSNQYAPCSVVYSSDGCFGLDITTVDDMSGNANSIQSISATSASTTVTIPDATGTVISFAESSTFFDESAGTVDVVVVLSTAAAAATNVAITLEAVAADETAATELDDFTTETVAVVPMGNFRGTATVTIIDDSVLECLESIVFSLTAPAGETVVEPSTTTLNIQDNDPAVDIDVKTSMTSISVNENDGCFRIGLEASAVSECPYVGSYFVCGGTATPNEDIYASCNYQLPSTSTSQQIRLCLNDDTFQEGTENVYVAIMPPSVRGSTFQRLAEITIADDEATGGDLVGISFTGGMATGTVEESGTMTAEIEVQVATSFVGSVTLGYGPGDLTVGDDFTIDTTTVTFDGTITTATATVTAVDDTLAESLTETIEIFVVSSDNPVDELSSTVTLSVTDNDLELTLFPSVVLAAEGATVQFVLALDKESPSNINNVVSTTDLTTSAGDYSPFSMSMVDINIGERFVDFQFVIFSGDTAEITEVVEIVATDGVSTATATVTIYDESNFGAKDALLLASQYAVLEDVGTFNLDFITPGGVGGIIAFDLGTSSALSGFTLSPTAPGPVAVPGPLAVTVAGDNLVDQVSQDQVIITFTNDDVFPQMSAEILIFDDETPVTVDCITPTAYACEEDGVAVVEFMYMFSETGSTINLGILYADGTAEETFDFAVIDSSVSLDVASSGTATVTVSILSDMESESEEEFYVYVEHNSYQTSTTATCTVVILDNDQPASTTALASTTAPVSTTFLASTTDSETTTNRPTTPIPLSTTDVTGEVTTTFLPSTTADLTTTNRPTTTENPTTTDVPTTTNRPTTTESPTTTDMPSTTGVPTTTGEVTTTFLPSTTPDLTTTNRPTTTENPTTTEIPTTSNRPTTTESPTTTDTPSTTGVPTTTGEVTTTVLPSTTPDLTTTNRPTTTENPTTTEIPTTTNRPTTTESPTTTDMPSTTGVPTTTGEGTTTVLPSTTPDLTTTNRPTTTENPTTTDIPTTSNRPTTTESPTTTDMPSTTGAPTTTGKVTTTVLPSTTDSLSTTTEGATTTEVTTTGGLTTTVRTTTAMETTTDTSTTGPRTTTEPDIITTTPPGLPTTKGPISTVDIRTMTTTDGPTSTIVSQSSPASSTVVSTTPMRSTTVATPVTIFTTSEAPETTSSAGTTDIPGSTGISQTTSISGVSQTTSISGVSQTTGISEPGLTQTTADGTVETTVLVSETTNVVETTSESVCPTECADGGFLCSCGPCLLVTQICDLIADCPLGEDEELPNCASCLLVPFENAQAIQTDTRHGRLITYQCLDGFSLPSGVVTFSFLCDNGLLRATNPGPNPVCIPSCALVNFQCVTSGTCIPRDNICDGTSHCSDESDESSAVCSEICSPVPPPVNGFEVSAQARYLNGETATFACLESFTLSGSASITCQQGVFQPDPPTCLASCSSLAGAFPNSQIVSESLLHLGQVELQCNSGFQLSTGSSSFSLTCFDGSWLTDDPGATPICSFVTGPCASCGANEDCVNSVCQCSPGYELVNDVCEDTNECHTLTCSSPYEACFNTLGSFICRNVTTIYYDFSNDLEVRTFFDLGFIPNPCISPSMTIPGGLPIGDQFYQRLYFTCNGIIAYGNNDDLSSPMTFSTPVDFNGREQHPLSAVFWTLADFSSRGRMYYRTYQIGGNNGADDDVLATIGLEVRQFDQEALDNNYIPIWALIITWEGVPQPVDDPLLYPNRLNTYQAVLSTNGLQTYIVHFYQEGSLQWSTPDQLSASLVIGFTDASGIFQNVHLDTNTFPSPLQEFQIDRRIGNTLNLGQWIFRLDQIPYGSTGAKAQCRTRYFADDDFNVLDLVNSRICPCQYDPFDADFISCLRPRDTLSAEAVVGAQVLINCLQQWPPETVRDGDNNIVAQYGSYCYYDFDGNLISGRGETAWTSSYVQRWHNDVFVNDDSITDNWLDEDILFRYYCCFDDDSTEASCSLYESRRPALTCSGLFFATADVTGDPHFITMDGARYTFNGLGEFVMIRSRGLLELQCRTGHARNQLGEVVTSATVFVGFAVQFLGHQLQVVLNKERTAVEVSHNDKVVSGLAIGEPFYTEDGEVLVLLEANPQTGQEDVVALFVHSGNNTKLVFSVVSGTLSLKFVTKGNIAENSVGLLGSQNGNPRDDFTFPDGSRLEIREGEVITDASVYPFGLAWRTTMETSLFTYGADESWETINDVNHQPVFYEELIANQSLSSRVEEVARECSGVKECMFDALVTNNMDLATFSRDFVIEDSRQRMVADNNPPRFVSITELDGDDDQPAVRANTTLLVKLGNSYTYRVLFSDPDEGDNITLYLREEVPGASIEDGDILRYTPQGKNPVQIVLVATDGLVPINQALTVLLCDCLGGDCNFNRILPGERVNRFALVGCNCFDSYTGIECREDYDECLDDPCYPGVTCIDLPPPEGSALCSECPAPLLGDGVTCEDYDQCADSSDNLCQQQCENIEGSYRCSCDDGYELLPDGFNCQDVDECDRGTHRCGIGGTCINHMGSYTCSCPTGFTLSSDGTACEDVNECLDGQACFVGAWCYNTLGTFKCECPPGYVNDAGRCVDLDECLSDDLNNCGPNADCLNLQGSFRCICRYGYHGVGTACQDINECNSGYYCHPDFECVNMEQGYTCFCPEGYQGDGNECFDVDECSLGSQSCPRHSTCINTAGSYSCTCDQGYRLSADGTCTNIDECDESPFICGRSQCIDTDGSFICECPSDSFRYHQAACLSLQFNCDFSEFCIEGACTNATCVCDEGYKLSLEYDRCVDIDECLYQIDDCGSNEICVNNPGSFSCDCKPGYTKNGTSCQDINECADPGSFTCHRNAICVNTPGSYQCHCGEFYQGNGIHCIDKNECLYGPGCGLNAICENLSPGFRCICPNGFEEDGSDCRDMDECLTDPCISDATCHNTPGSFYCSCIPGYFGDGRIGHYGCHDVDECFEQAHACPEFSTCSNSDGTYSCQCFPGYEPVGSDCIDIDECAIGFHDCDRNATCVNLGGSFTCECNEGFFSWGRQAGAGLARGPDGCADIDECALGVHDCHENADCSNEVGGYRCTCRSGYEGDGHTCLDLNECETSIPCADQSDKICLNREGTYQCVCQFGFTEEAGGNCRGADTVQLNIIFTDIKGLQTNVNYHLITEADLDQLTEDIRRILDDSALSSDILNIRINSMIQTDSLYAQVSLRVDLDDTSSASPEMVMEAFNGGLSGRDNRLVFPDSRVLSATSEVPAIDPCRTGTHDCFDSMFRRCLYSGAGQYQCTECRQHFVQVNGVCVADPCQTGSNDCQDRHFDECVFLQSGEYNCETCSEGYVPEGESTCIPDPCAEGLRVCSLQNFNRCVVDGINTFHCEECRLGFTLENGRCIDDTANNPCFNGVGTCSERLYQNCIYDAANDTYHCENCLPEHKEEGDRCFADPCQLGLSDCQQRNFERCLYQSGGRFTCEMCRVGFTEVEGSCVSTSTPEFRRFRGRIRATAVNSSAELAVYRPDLQDVSSRLFQEYEIQFCDVFTHSLLTHNPSLSRDFIQCFMLAFREGSVISYFVIDVTAASFLQPIDFEVTIIAAAQEVDQNLYLYNRFATRSLTIDGSSVNFLDTSRYGCNRNSICQNGGSCIEDPQVYDYVCRCPPEFTGDRCHLRVSTTVNTTPAVVPTDETEGGVAVLLVVLAVVVIFMVILLSACCCCFVMMNMQAKRRTMEQQRAQAIQELNRRRYAAYRRRARGDVSVVRNMFAKKLAEYDEDVEMDEYKDADYSEENVRHDERRLRHLSDVLRHADFLNERMMHHGHNLPIRNYAYSDDESENQEFEVPLVADGSEFASVQKKQSPDTSELDTISESIEMDVVSSAASSSELPPYSEVEKDLKKNSYF